MTEQFKREYRYIVFKIADSHAFLSDEQQDDMAEMLNVIEKGRLAAGKPSHSYVVVADDWPEYGPVWKMIEERITGKVSIPPYFTLAQVDARIASKDAEIERLRVEVERLTKSWQSDVWQLTTERDATITHQAERIAELEKYDHYDGDAYRRQVAAQSAALAKARAFIDEWLRENDPTNHQPFCDCDPSVGYQCAVCNPPKAVIEASEALAAIDALDQTVEPAQITDAAHDVLAERQRQVSAEGWTTDHDDEHEDGDMARAAACYALSSAGYRGDDVAQLRFWPWMDAWWKPSTPRRDLVKAGALIIAEIERLDRARLGQPEGEKGGAE